MSLSHCHVVTFIKSDLLTGFQNKIKKSILVVEPKLATLASLCWKAFCTSVSAASLFQILYNL